MKILIVTQYFYPENFRINDYAFSLQEMGHSVDVLTGKPNYPKGNYFKGYSWKNPSKEIIRDVHVHRANVILRKNSGKIRLILNYFSFVFFGFFKLLKLRGNFDVVFVYAPSPITVGFLGAFAAKKFKCLSYLWVNDLWPDSIVYGGIKSSFIFKLTDRMTRFIYKINDVILVQSPYFKKYLKAQKVPMEKVIYYPVYAEDFYKPLPPSQKYKHLFPYGFNIVFTGNIGQAQSFDTLIKAFEILKDHPINLIIFGDGRYKKEAVALIKQKQLNNIYFRGTFPPDTLSEILSNADALLLSLKNTTINSYTIPGKFASYIACGKPIIASINGVVAKFIDDAQMGLVAPAGDFQSLAEKIIFLTKFSKIDLAEFGKNARACYLKNFQKSRLLYELTNHIFKNKKI